MGRGPAGPGLTSPTAPSPPGALGPALPIAFAVTSEPSSQVWTYLRGFDRTHVFASGCGSEGTDSRRGLPGEAGVSPGKPERAQRGYETRDVNAHRSLPTSHLLHVALRPPACCPRCTSAVWLPAPLPAPRGPASAGRPPGPTPSGQQLVGQVPPLIRGQSGTGNGPWKVGPGDLLHGYHKGMLGHLVP